MGRKEEKLQNMGSPKPLSLLTRSSFSTPYPNPQRKDLPSIVLEFQYCSENEKPVNAVRRWGTKEHLAPLGQLKIPFILAESSVIDPASQRPEFLFLEGAGGVGDGGRVSIKS